MDGHNHKSGEDCPICRRGALGVYASKRIGAIRVQYLACETCGGKPNGNKVVVPDDQIRHRRINARRT